MRLLLSVIMSLTKLYREISLVIRKLLQVTCLTNWLFNVTDAGMFIKKLYDLNLKCPFQESEKGFTKGKLFQK